MARDKAPVPDLGVIEFARWAWRQLTSMRTALILLLLLALGAVPGSVVPQSNVDSFKVGQWQKAHPKLTPYYEKLGLFSVFDSFWFSAIYLLLVISLVGCIVPRLRVYARGVRAQPPAAPRNLTRLPNSATYECEAEPDEVLAAARMLLRKRMFRIAREGGSDVVSAERGYLREAGNLLFHMAILVVLAGFATGSLWGYKGGAIVVKGDEFSNTPLLYDDFEPGRFTEASDLDEFSFSVDDFDIEWLRSGPRQGMARKFDAHLTWRGADGVAHSDDLRVNHPLSVGGTDVFLVGHGYAPVITVRDGKGNIAYSGPTPFLPQDQQTFASFGVIKASGAQPQQIGLQGLMFPTYVRRGMEFGSVFGDDLNPFISMTAYVGDLGMGEGKPQSVYALDTSRMKQLKKPDGSMFRVDLAVGESVDLPGGNGTVTFEGVEPWVRVQVAKKPGTSLALAGAIMALLGMCGSLFIRPRRVWVRVRREGGRTVVELAVLDRSSGGEPGRELERIRAGLMADESGPDGPGPASVEEA